MTHPRFEEYSRLEAEEVGAAFLRAFQDRADDLRDAGFTAQWTEVILDWFAATKPAAGVVVDATKPKAPSNLPHTALGQMSPASRPDSGECMIDLTHYRFDAYGTDYGSLAYWQQAYGPSRAPEMLLALESENGKCGGRPANMAAVFEDASKLVAVAARLKVVVFGSNETEERDKIRSVASLMQRQDYTRARPAEGSEFGARPTWLWLDLPWSDWNTHGPNGWIGTAGDGVVVDLEF